MLDMWHCNEWYSSNLNPPATHSVTPHTPPQYLTFKPLYAICTFRSEKPGVSFFQRWHQNREAIGIKNVFFCQTKNFFMCLMDGSPVAGWHGWRGILRSVPCHAEGGPTRVRGPVLGLDKDSVFILRFLQFNSGTSLKTCFKHFFNGVPETPNLIRESPILFLFSKEDAWRSANNEVDCVQDIRLNMMQKRKWKKTRN